MKPIKYTCPKCGDARFIVSFWKWFWTPHFGARKYLKCKRCKCIRLMNRWDGRKWVDWPTEKGNK